MKITRNKNKNSKEFTSSNLKDHFLHKVCFLFIENISKNYIIIEISTFFFPEPVYFGISEDAPIVSVQL